MRSYFCNQSHSNAAELVWYVRIDTFNPQLSRSNSTKDILAFITLDIHSCRVTLATLADS